MTANTANATLPIVVGDHTLSARRIGYRPGTATFTAAAGAEANATLTLERREFGALSMAGALTAFPFMTLKVIGAIYWQALRLWQKRVPFHPHPAGQQEAGRSNVAEGTPP